MNSRRTAAGATGWLETKSINQRLTIQVTAAIVASICLIAAITVGSLVCLDYTKRNADLSSQALRAALLEKDFTSLERDVFRHGLLRNEDSRKSYEGNIGDLKRSINETDKLLSADHDADLKKVAQGADDYVRVVNGVMAGGSFDAGGEAQISAAGDTVDSAIEGIRQPAIDAANAMSVRQQRTVTLIMVMTIAIAMITGLVTLFIARGIKRAIGQEIESLSEAITRIAAGDVDVQIAYSRARRPAGRTGACRHRAARDEPRQAAIGCRTHRYGRQGWHQPASHGGGRSHHSSAGSWRRLCAAPA